MLLEKAVLNRRLGDYTGSTNALQDLLNMPEEKKTHGQSLAYKVLGND